MRRIGQHMGCERALISSIFPDGESRTAWETAWPLGWRPFRTPSAERRAQRREAE